MNVVPISKILLISAAALAACSEQPAPATPAPEPVASAPPTDAWLGQWPGVEGTFLKIERAGSAGAYTLTQGTLDGVLTYVGVAEGSAIAFERDGQKETVRAGTGAETGLKWLAEKNNCLVIKPGEGYCR